MLERVQREIDSLHYFFQEWFSGHLDARDENLKILYEAFAKDFRMITPQGTLQKRKEVLQSIRDGWGKLKPMEISIGDVQILFEDKAIVVATYKESQRINQLETTRMSTVIFLKQQKGALQWLFVQETMLEEHL